MLGIAFGDERAEVHAHDVGQDLHDELHVVLDDEDGEAEVRVNLLDQAVQVLHFLGIHARRGLVQEEQPGLQGEGPGDLQAPLVPVGKGGGGLVRPVGEPHPFEKRHAPVPDLPFHGAPAPEMGAGVEEGVAVVLLTGGHDVLQDGGAGEEAQVLEGPGDAFAHTLRRSCGW